MFVESLFNSFFNSFFKSLVASLTRLFISPLSRDFVKFFVSHLAGSLAGFIRQLIRWLGGLSFRLSVGSIFSRFFSRLISCFGGAACVSVILAVTASAVALVALLSTSPLSHGLDDAVRLSWWF
jgi:hypothetical protein